MQDTSRRRSEAEEDDWSQIANQTLRKRIQNRLAQRKHRSGIKARIAELERLASQKDGSSATMQPSMADANLEVTMQRAGFSSIDSNNNNTNSTHPLHLNRHCPSNSNSNSNSNYPAVTVSGGQGLNSGTALPVLRDVPFAPNFSVPEHVDDGGLSPIFLEGYTHGADGIAQYLDQRRDVPSFHQHLQSYAAVSDQHVQADCGAASGNQLNLDSLSAHSLCSHGSSKCSRNPSLIGTSSSSSTTSPSSRPSTNSTDPYLSQSATSRRTSKSQRHNSSASTSRTMDSLSMDEDDSPETPAALSTRIAAAIKSIRLLGFAGIEELTTQFYTADLHDLPALADAQRTSRRRGLPRILTQLREHANDGWSDWEAHGYREEIVHAAEEILSDECGRFLEKHDDRRSSRSGKDKAQLKRQFQDELPNLYGVLGVLCSSSKDWGDKDHSAVIVNAINSILSGSARSS